MRLFYHKPNKKPNFDVTPVINWISMKHNYTLRCLFLAALCLSSCEKPIDLEFEETPRLVVNSRFSNDEGIVVFVSSTGSVFENESGGYVTNATVQLLIGKDMLEELEFVPQNTLTNEPPYFVTNLFSAKVGEEYVLIVSAPGYKTVTATNRIPVSVPLESVDFSNTLTNTGHQQTTVDFNVSVCLTDMPGVKNYYHLVFYQAMHPFQLSPDGTDTLIGAINFGTKINAHAVDALVPVFAYDSQSFLFKDQRLNQSFDGTKISLPFSGSYTFDSNEFVPGDFFVELRTVSEEYYLHLSTLTRQEGTNHPVGEGVIIAGNIVNGEGLFGGYSSSSNSFRVGN